MNKKTWKIIKIILVNSITIFRLIGALSLPFLLHLYGISFVSLFIIILFLSDSIDGFLARKLKVSTFFGCMMDGVSDKVLNTIAFIILSLQYNFMLAPMVIEIAIMYTMYSTYRYGGNVKTSKIGKIKTIFLDLFVILSFILMSLPLFSTKTKIVRYLIGHTELFVNSFAFIIILACLITLFDYLRKNTYARLNPDCNKIKYERKKKKPASLVIKQLFDTSYYAKHKDESIARQLYI